jgi:putative tricarboxylic transport membrane protein
MTGFDQLVAGFAVALSWKGLLYCFIGCLWGTIVGVLPGLGPLAGMTLLLPLTFGLEPSIGIIMLTGIFYGAMYGGSTTSILVRIPGEAASVITCIDGYEMARKGRAGPALMIAAVGSFIGGTVSILGLMFIAPPLAKVMIAIGPSVEVVLMLLALSVITMVSAGSRLKTALMVVLGLLLGSIGLDNITGTARFTFGYTSLAGGLSFTALAIGLFGVSEILINLEKTETIKAIQPKLRDLVPHWKDLRAAAPAIGRGSIIGFIFGIIPGVSHVVSTFVSYAIEKKFSRHPEEFGKGAIEGVAGPETANNAVTGTAMIPLLALGIPSIPATAILLSALTIHGVQPGPLLLTDHPDVFWSLVASMYIGNVILLILNLPLVGMFVNADSLCLAGADHPHHLDHRGLQRELLGRRHLDHGDLGRRRLCAAQVRLRDGATLAGAGARRPPGVELPAGAHDVGRQLCDFRRQGVGDRAQLGARHPAGGAGLCVGVRLSQDDRG